MDLEKIREEIHPHERKVLLALNKLRGQATPDQILTETDLKELVSVMRACSWLQKKGLIEAIEEKIVRFFSLGSEGVKYQKNNLPERRVLNVLVKERKISFDDLTKKCGLESNEINIALIWLQRKRWAELVYEPDESGVRIAALKITDVGERSARSKGSDEELLSSLSQTEEKSENELEPEVQYFELAVEQLKSRKNVIQIVRRTSRTFKLTETGNKLLNLGIEVTEEISQLTPEIVQTGAWKKVKFRKYDVTAPAPLLHLGRAHPLIQIIDQIREIFLEMGFAEIKSPIVESAFWNFDALFQPQDHPAREMMDTLYLSQPKTARLPSESLVESIAKTHENGGTTGSIGWGYKWNKEISKQVILRTHTTATTIRHLAEHTQPPVKVFCVGKVFRRERVDFKHLPEFYQVDGIVMDKGVTFSNLFGVLKEFYRKMGFEQVRFRPGYFPYTEPSLEIDIFFPEKGKWLELGGSGIFRPEVTLPLGIEYPVLAWGLSIERLAMLKFGLEDIRTLYFCDLEWLRSTHIL